MCFLLGHKAAGPLPSRCRRCDMPMGRRIAPDEWYEPIELAPEARRMGTISETEAVLLAALGDIKRLGDGDRGQTHHANCQHAPCIAARAIDAYWEIARRPFLTDPTGRRS